MTNTRNSLANLIATDAIESIGEKNVKRIYSKSVEYKKLLKSIIEQADKNFDYIDVLSTIMDVAYVENDKEKFIQSYKKLEKAIDLMDESSVISEFKEVYQQDEEEIVADASVIL